MFSGNITVAVTATITAITATAPATTSSDFITMGHTTPPPARVALVGCVARAVLCTAATAAAVAFDIGCARRLPSSPSSAGPVLWHMRIALLVITGTRLGTARIRWAASTRRGARPTITGAGALDNHRPEALAATAALGTFRPFAPRPHAILIATPVCDGSPNRREHQQCKREAARGSHPGAILGQFSQ